MNGNEAFQVCVEKLLGATFTIIKFIRYSNLRIESTNYNQFQQ